MQFYFCFVINEIALLISLLGNSILTYGSTFDFIMLSLYTANFAKQLYSFFSESLLSFILYCVSPVTIWFFSGVASLCFFLLPNWLWPGFLPFWRWKVVKLLVLFFFQVWKSNLPVLPHSLLDYVLSCKYFMLMVLPSMFNLFSVLIIKIHWIINICV